MKITINGEDHFIGWTHLPNTEEMQGGSICEITKRGFIPVTKGISTLNPADSPNKIIGRKISLARALKASSFSKEVKKQIWDLYFKTCKSTKIDPLKIKTKIN